MPSVQHVDIRYELVMDHCSIYFPNANELTISGDTYMPRESVATDLSRTVPLENLNKINITCEQFSFNTIMKLLCFTPNCSKLILDFIPLDTALLQGAETFQLASNINKITVLTVTWICSFEKVKLLVKLCPQLQHLTISVAEEFISIVQFLIPQVDNDSRHLLSLSIHTMGIGSCDKLINLHQQLEQSNNFSYKQTDFSDFYLWF